MALRLYAALLLALAAPLLAGGVYLVTLGGSPYYALAGASLALVGTLLWRQSRTGAWLLFGLILMTVAWAIFEVGLSPWELMPRLVAWFVVGSILLIPVLRRALRSDAKEATRSTARSGAIILALSLGSVGLGELLHAANAGPDDPRFQAGTGPFPAVRNAIALALGSDWAHWGNDQGGTRFSPLAQISAANVENLQLAWKAPVFLTPNGKGSGLEGTPLMVGDALFTCNNANEVFAIDAETGQRRWATGVAGDKGRTCRGVAYYEVPGAAGPCSKRIITATGIATLVALDSLTGKPCVSFGVNGQVDLLEGLSPAPKAYYHVTSAPEVVRDHIIIGGWVSDGQYWGEPSGVVRAFDALTGKLSWAWDMGRPDQPAAPPPGQYYTPSTPNSWAPISADEKLGLVYLPTGNATPDYFGAQRRSFDDRYSSSIVALDIQTGRRWSFQTVHHDLWDYDVASQPMLVDLPVPFGGTRAALVQLTKRGEIFLLDRATGRPLHPVTEKPVSRAGAVPQERISPTQPFSSSLPSFRGPDIRESDMWGVTPLDQMLCRIRFRQARYQGSMTPPGLTSWIASPGYVGGMDWGSGSVDPSRGVLFVNSAKLANYDRLLTRAEADRDNLKPLGDYAGVAEVGKAVAQARTPYAASITPFMSPLGIPCQAPPYGYMSAIDLVTGRLIWSHPLGSAEDLGPWGTRSHLPYDIGTPMIGGSIATAGGLVFIGASFDRRFRALDAGTGRQLWQQSLPRGAFSDPMTYTSPRSGRQFVVVAVGGKQGVGETNGAELMAFALPLRR